MKNNTSCKKVETFGAPREIRLGVEVLKEEELFLTTLPDGAIPPNDRAGLGLYYRDTRFLSCLDVVLNGTLPVFLSAIYEEGYFAQVELANKVLENGASPVPAKVIHLRYLRALHEGLIQRLRLINFHYEPVKLSLEIRVGADFVDIFEVRGFERAKRGKLLAPRKVKNGLVFAYMGLDGKYRSTIVSFYPTPRQIQFHSNGLATIAFEFLLLPQKKYYVYMRIVPLIGKHIGIPPEKGPRRVISVFTKNLPYKSNQCEQWRRRCANFHSSNLILSQMFEQGIADLHSLRTKYPGLGTIIEAGVPWYAAPFGRDSLVVAWQTLLVNPDIARQTLHFLARLQGKEVNPSRDEEPGKILHELRRGEMANCGEIPHTPYYGSVDSTLWFIILLSETYLWTQDMNLLTKMAGPLKKALEWCFRYGDIDGDGFIEYTQKAKGGLLNQGWKDSWNSVVDEDGNLARGSVALVEVQGYFYLALVRAAELYDCLGQPEQALELRRRAAELKENFLRAYWCKEREYPAFALDGDKHPLNAVVSNPGHLLFTGMLPKEYATKVAQRLFKSDMYSGWGIRTMSKKEVAYNPMSYHNGSVWPHDNAVIAVGLGLYGKDRLVGRLLNDLFYAAMNFPHYRLPELFCGFTRRGESGPVHYPVACSPQAWAVGAVFQLFNVVLGIRCRGPEVYISRPSLPSFVDDIVIRNIIAGNGSVDLEFTRKGNKTYCSVLKISGDVKVIFS